MPLNGSPHGCRCCRGIWPLRLADQQRWLLPSVPAPRWGGLRALEPLRFCRRSCWRCPAWSSRSFVRQPLPRAVRVLPPPCRLSCWHCRAWCSRNCAWPPESLEGPGPTSQPSCKRSCSRCPVSSSHNCVVLAHLQARLIRQTTRVKQPTQTRSA